jgi:predicted nucleotidyltransferase
MAEPSKRGLGISEIIGDKRAQVLEIARRHGAYNVRVFGSVARGEARPDSDVDVLVEFPPKYRLFDHIGLMQDLEDLLGRKVDVSIERNLRKEFRPYVMKDVVAL